MTERSNKDCRDVLENNSSVPLHIDKVRNVISQIKTHSDSLAREGVDIHSLSSHIATIERELEKPGPQHSQIRDALVLLQIGFGKIDQKLISSSALTLLNQVLGTGIPS